MGKPPCCDKVGIKKGPWTPEEDIILVSYIQEHGPGNWGSVPKNTGLSRCSKSCRLRWTNYLRPGIKRGNFTSNEEGMIIHLQSLLGNKWAAIASYLPQRTDNDIKNYWNTHLKKKLNKFQSALEVPLHMAQQGSSIIPCQIVSKSLNDRRSSLEFGASSNSTTNLKLNQTTSTYASSTENISRLLEGWMTRSSPKTVILKEVAAEKQEQWNQSNSFDNNDSIGSSSAAAAAAATNSLQGGYCRSQDENEGGDLIFHEEFESILSFGNVNNVAWDESSGQVEEMNQMMEPSSIF